MDNVETTASTVSMVPAASVYMDGTVLIARKLVKGAGTIDVKEAQGDVYSVRLDTTLMHVIKDVHLTVVKAMMGTGTVTVTQGGA